ncbi:hypothetical protein VNO77_21051 [Canavalia gladiata]|uniref:Uncharacterized protein n=1 Tax=Canavalia gladiata TaxID=3824 RepID=A0AAN9LQN5_CANGL
MVQLITQRHAHDTSSVCVSLSLSFSLSFSLRAPTALVLFDPSSILLALLSPKGRNQIRLSSPILTPLFSD